MVEPISLLAGATALADLVSLIAEFKALRENRDSKTIAEYLEWLRRQNHTELVERIESSADLTAALGELLACHHDEVMARLAALDKTMSAIASAFAEFRALAVSAHPDTVLSDQAVSFLRQLNRAGASFMIEHHTNEGHHYQMRDGDYKFCGRLEIQDKRFREVDLERLCELSLLTLRHEGRNRFFYLTHEGAMVAGNA
jgi:hypothetical protein